MAAAASTGGLRAAERSDRDKFADQALDAAKKAGAAYADMRISRYDYQDISTRERQVQKSSRPRATVTACGF